MNHSEILAKLGNSQNLIEFATTPGRAFILVAQLQLALRHPGNTGEGATVAYQIAQNLAKAICSYVPEAKELIDQGWNPAYDVTKDYFDAEFSEEGDRHDQY